MKNTSYSIFFNNFGYTAQETFETLEAAKAYCERCAFDASVYDSTSEMVGYYTLGAWHFCK